MTSRGRFTEHGVGEAKVRRYPEAWRHVRNVDPALSEHSRLLMRASTQQLQNPFSSKPDTFIFSLNVIEAWTTFQLRPKQIAPWTETCMSSASAKFIIGMACIVRAKMCFDRILDSRNVVPYRRDLLRKVDLFGNSQWRI